MAPLTSKAVILMATFNGERFLQQQLDSIFLQKETDWHLVVSDDGSTDRTIDILSEFYSAHPGRMTIVRSTGRGPAQNFLNLARTNWLHANYWVFCDQDDVWEDDRLSRALSKLANIPVEVPSMHCSRVIYINQGNSPTGLSPKVCYPPGFGKSLLINIASGNTMTFSEGARRLLCKADPQYVHFHDWLLYMTVSACGGVVIYDSHPSVRYRQHSRNVLGPMTGASAYFRRARLIFSGRYSLWRAANIAALSPLLGDMTEKNRAILADFSSLNDASLLRRFAILKRCGICARLPIPGLLLAVSLVFGRG